MDANKQPKRVLIVLPDGFEILEAAAFLDVLGWANEYGDAPIEVVTAGFSREVRCTFHSLTVLPQVQLSEVQADRFDAVCLPGGFETWGFYKEAFAEPLLALLAEFDRSAKPIATICVGALPLAMSGVLRGRTATTYSYGDQRRNQLEALGAVLGDERIVVDRNVITSESPETAVHVALKLLETLTDTPNAAKIGEMMGYAVAPSGSGT